VIAIMIALTVVAVAGGLALGNLASNARAEIDGGVTVQIVEGAPQERSNQADLALAILGNRDDVVEVRRVPDEDIAALLQPWLGDTVFADDAIPTPALIDLRLSGEVDEVRLADLRASLAQAAPSARVDGQASWLAPALEAIASLQYLALGLVLLLAATSVAAVWLAARNALGVNRTTIDVIHHLGATDSQIAGIFQRSIALDALAGGAAGLLVGLGAILLLGQQFAGLGSGLIEGGGLSQTDWIIIASIPILGAILAVVTARMTITSALRQIL
jgi:cell division transport system permease protein